MICQKIEQAVEDGKRGAAAAVSQSAAVDPVSALIEQIRNAPDLDTVTRIQHTLTILIMNDPNKERLMSQISAAIADATVRIETQIAASNFAAPAQDFSKPKFCPGCGAPYEGGRFCQNCGTKL
jgi:predicted regulator of amino acid metabolism with ACT domain